MSKEIIKDKMIYEFEKQFKNECIMLISSVEDLTSGNNNNDYEIEITTCNFDKYKVIYHNENNIEITKI